MSSFESIALELCSHVSQVTKILKSNSIPSPSFEEQNYNSFEDAVGIEDAELRQARNSIVNLAHKLIQLSLGPTDQILTLAFSAADSANLGIITRFGLPQAVPIGSTIPVEELAKVVGLPVATLLRVLRYAVGNGIFTEPKQGHFGHNAASCAMAKNKHIQDIALFATHELATTLVRVPDALKLQKDQPMDLAPHAAFNLAYPEYTDAFDYFNRNKESNERYHAYLHGRINTSRWAVDHFTNSWDWASLGSSTVVDCGGSIGHTCVALASICPNAKFVVQDMSLDAIASGKQWISEKHAALSPRISFVEHDFFTPQPLSADIYIFRHILHDWSDADCLRILHSLLPALKPGTKVLISEGVVPDEPAEPSFTLDQKQIRNEDAIMLGVHNAQERTVAEFKHLFKSASPYFRFNQKTGGSAGAFQSLLEFEYTAQCEQCGRVPR